MILQPKRLRSRKYLYPQSRVYPQQSLKRRQCWLRSAYSAAQKCVNIFSHLYSLQIVLQSPSKWLSPNARCQKLCLKASTLLLKANTAGLTKNPARSLPWSPEIYYQHNGLLCLQLCLMLEVRFCTLRGFNTCPCVINYC